MKFTPNPEGCNCALFGDHNGSYTYINKNNNTVHVCNDCGTIIGMEVDED